MIRFLVLFLVVVNYSPKALMAGDTPNIVLIFIDDEDEDDVGFDCFSGAPLFLRYCQNTREQ